MDITFAPRGILQIDNARFAFRPNFSGAAGTYNREGERNFTVRIESEELADRLVEEGWNVKVKPPREEGDAPYLYLTVKVKFNERGPNVYLVTNGRQNRLDEGSVCILDEIDIASVDMDLRPYDWEVNGKTGRTAYLQSMRAVQQITDRFAPNDRYSDMYSDEDAPEY